MRFEDQVMVVTGAARGIGFTTAAMAAEEGAQVVICDLSQEAVDAAAAKIREAGGSAMAIAGDVSCQGDVRRGVDAIMAALGRIDVLVNNAAINTHHPTATMPEAIWQRELAVCLTGPFLWSQAVGVASMIPRRKGAIVNIGSGAALAGLPNCAAYVAAKHGVVGLTKSLAVDWGQHNIRVNCVCPGLTFTELAKAAARKDPEMIRQRELRIPLGRGAEPEDVARSILFLGSSEADAISGVALGVDGGTLAMSSGYSAPRGG
jgi:NAD(P)-dependent dehydrogenase (short-subunit alcohol dehydrogenase family)